MGGSFSAGRSNDELVHNLAAQHAQKAMPHVEKLMLGVDRANYYLSGFQHFAYRDQAWRHNNIHISAPVIYWEVLDMLQLKPGLSFLNLGSGTGYLSTMAGLELGSNGVNHGIELHQDVIDHAREKLDHFKQSSESIDRYDFCEPVFVQGNCLSLPEDCCQYDRIYCGAACPDEKGDFMKNLVKVGGILVMPYRGYLVQVKRVGPNKFKINSRMQVAFSSLQDPADSKESTPAQLPQLNPKELRDLARIKIRQCVRSVLEAEIPEIRKLKKFVPKAGSADAELCTNFEFQNSDDEEDYLMTERVRREIHRAHGRAERLRLSFAERVIVSESMEHDGSRTTVSDAETEQTDDENDLKEKLRSVLKVEGTKASSENVDNGSSEPNGSKSDQPSPLKDSETELDIIGGAIDLCEKSTHYGVSNSKPKRLTSSSTDVCSQETRDIVSRALYRHRNRPSLKNEIDSCVENIESEREGNVENFLGESPVLDCERKKSNFKREKFDSGVVADESSSYSSSESGASNDSAIDNASRLFPIESSNDERQPSVDSVETLDSQSLGNVERSNAGKRQCSQSSSVDSVEASNGGPRHSRCTNQSDSKLLISNYPLNADHESSNVNHESSNANHESSNANHESSNANHESSNAYHESSNAYHESSNANHESSNANHESSNANHESSKVCQRQTPLAFLSLYRQRNLSGMKLGELFGDGVRTFLPPEERVSELLTRGVVRNHFLEDFIEERRQCLVRHSTSAEQSGETNDTHTELARSRTSNMSTDNIGSRTSNMSTDISGSRTSNMSTDISGFRTSNMSTDISGSRTSNMSIDISGFRTSNMSTDISGCRTSNMSTDISGSRTSNMSTDISGSRTSNMSTDISGSRTSNMSTDISGSRTSNMSTHISEYGNSDTSNERSRFRLVHNFRDDGCENGPESDKCSMCPHPNFRQLQTLAQKLNEFTSDEHMMNQRTSRELGDSEQLNDLEQSNAIQPTGCDREYLKTVSRAKERCGKEMLVTESNMGRVDRSSSRDKESSLDRIELEGPVSEFINHLDESLDRMNGWITSSQLNERNLGKSSNGMDEPSSIIEDVLGEASELDESRMNELLNPTDESTSRQLSSRVSRLDYSPPKSEWKRKYVPETEQEGDDYFSSNSDGNVNEENGATAQDRKCPGKRSKKFKDKSLTREEIGASNVNDSESHLDKSNLDHSGSTLDTSDSNLDYPQAIPHAIDVLTRARDLMVEFDDNMESDEPAGRNGDDMDELSDWSDDEGEDEASVEVEEEEEEEEDGDRPSYWVLMRERIQALPLPNSVKLYLNFGREF